MGKDEMHYSSEVNDLRHDLDHFQKEKERVRTIVGKIGGIPAFNIKVYNIIFLVLIVTSLVISLISHGTLSTAMIELAVAALSLKIILLMHNQGRVNHFQLWILSALEWRLDELRREIKKLNQRQEESAEGSSPAPPPSGEGDDIT